MALISITSASSVEKKKVVKSLFYEVEIIALPFWKTQRRILERHIGHFDILARLNRLKQGSQKMWKQSKIACGLNKISKKIERITDKIMNV